MRIMKTVLVAVTCAALASCTGGRPSQENLSSALETGDSIVTVNTAQADCFARVLLESDLSDETLRAIAKADNTYAGDANEQATLTASLGYAQTVCAGGD